MPPNMPVQFPCTLPHQGRAGLSRYPHGRHMTWPATLTVNDDTTRHGRCPGGRIAALSTRKASRCDAPPPPGSYGGSMPNRYFLCELRFQGPRECAAFVFVRKFWGSRANEVNLTQIYSPRILAHCVTGYPCRSRWGPLLPQSDPQPCRLSAFQPIRSVETSLRQHGRSGPPPSNQALYEVCAK